MQILRSLLSLFAQRLIHLMGSLFYSFVLPMYCTSTFSQKSTEKDPDRVAFSFWIFVYIAFAAASFSVVGDCAGSMLIKDRAARPENAGQAALLMV